jgi:hypothetical protein
MNNHFSNQESNQVEIIEECKNSLNELIKASKWSTSQKIHNNNNEIIKVSNSPQPPPAIQTRFKYLDKSAKLGNFPNSNHQSNTYLIFEQNDKNNKNRFNNNYDNLVESPKLAPLATTSEMDDNFSVTLLSTPTEEYNGKCVFQFCFFNCI